MAVELRMVRRQCDPRHFSVARRNAAQTGTSETLYTLLALLCSGEAASYVRTTEDETCLQSVVGTVEGKKPSEIQFA